MSETMKPFTVYFSAGENTYVSSYILEGDEIYRFIGFDEDNEPIFGMMYGYGIMSFFRWVAVP